MDKPDDKPAQRPMAPSSDVGVARKKSRTPGRPKGSGPWKESTKVIRVAESLVGPIKEMLASMIDLRTLPPGIHFAQKGDPKPVPLFLESVRAGFPSPATGYEAGQLNVSDMLITNPPATYLLKASGDSMVDVGIFDGDYLVVDLSKTPKHGDTVIARVGTDFTVKTLKLAAGQIELHPANAAANYPVISPKGGEEIEVLGVVTWTLKNMQ